MQELHHHQGASVTSEKIARRRRREYVAAQAAKIMEIYRTKGGWFMTTTTKRGLELALQEPPTHAPRNDAERSQDDKFYARRVQDVRNAARDLVAARQRAVDELAKTLGLAGARASSPRKTSSASPRVMRKQRRVKLAAQATLIMEIYKNQGGWFMSTTTSAGLELAKQLPTRPPKTDAERSQDDKFYARRVKDVTSAAKDLVAARQRAVEALKAQFLSPMPAP
jgi:hypothetical protein